MLKNILKQNMNISRIFSIEGNIASGKSTILDYLSSKNVDTIKCIKEPVAEWTNMKNGTDLLRLFYEQNSRWAYSFELLVQLSRLKAHYECKNHLNENKIDLFDGSSINNKDIKIFMERSIYSSFNVFSKNSLEEKGLTQVEFDILKKYFQLFSNEIENFTSNSSNTNNNYLFDESSNEIAKTSVPFKVIYIRTTPEKCFERMKERDRLSENSISIDYLRKIHSKYEDWIKEIKKDSLVIINGNLDKSKVLEQIDLYFNVIS